MTRSPRSIGLGLTLLLAVLGVLVRPAGVGAQNQPNIIDVTTSVAFSPDGTQVLAGGHRYEAGNPSAETRC